MDPKESLLVSYQALNASQDADAVVALERRLRDVAAARRTISYTELFRDIPLRLVGGKKHVTDHWQPTGFDRNLFKEYLGYLNYRSYSSRKRLISVLAVLKESGIPADFLFAWLVEAGFTTEAEKYRFWEAERDAVWKEYGAATSEPV